MTERSSHFDVIIVGAGHGGAQAAAALRSNKFAGTIAIIGAESELPYERPPLSKEYLAGEKEFERILIRPESFWAERDIQIVTKTKVVAIDPIHREVATSDRRTFSYGKLIWAAGGEPRRLSVPGGDLAGVYGVRNRADADAIKRDAKDAQQVVIVGGGYIGLEVAAVFAKSGKRVIILEALDRVLARVAGSELSSFYEAEHRAHGVDLRFGVTVAGIEGEDRATGVRLIDGQVIPADLIVVGIGIVPAVGPLIAAEAAGDNGVLVDQQCRTSLPHVYAIGDCAAHKNRFADGATIRLESVQNASDMANTAAKSICGLDALYDEVPWFWSNQYDLKLQTVGLSAGFDETVLRGDPATRSFSVVYLRDGKVIALDCVNRVKDYVQGKQLVAKGTIAPSERLADSSTPLKELALGSSPA